MKKNVFTPDFYEKLVDVIMNEVSGGNHYEELCEGETISGDGYIDDMYVTFDADYTTDVHDESFDHAFGTWHDPNPYVEADGISGLGNVHVYEDDEETEIEGFSYEAFWAQFEKHEKVVFYKNHWYHLTAGDKMMYMGKEAEFLAYNSMKSAYKLLCDDGNVHYLSDKAVHPIEKAA